METKTKSVVYRHAIYKELAKLWFAVLVETKTFPVVYCHDFLVDVPNSIIGFQLPNISDQVTLV